MVEKRLRGVLGISLLSLVSAACTEPTPSGKSPDAVVEKSSSALDGLQVVAVDEAAVPTFITGPLGAAPVEASAVNSVQPGQLRPVLERVTPLFRLNPDDLYLKMRTLLALRRCGASSALRGWTRRRCSSAVSTSTSSPVLAAAGAGDRLGHRGRSTGKQCARTQAAGAAHPLEGHRPPASEGDAHRGYRTPR
jgi:hypothetical protein